MALGQPLGALSQQSPFLLIDVTVEAGKRIALDPIAAIGYDYQIGAGDPLFASVELPDIGDGLFALYLFIGTDWIFDRVLSASEEYFFAGSGVDRFCILGIEEDAGLDPLDTTAFITNVTFAGDGRFTGTMTPITSTIIFASSGNDDLGNF